MHRAPSPTATSWLAIVLSLFGGSQWRMRTVASPSTGLARKRNLPAELAMFNLRETFGKALVRRAQALEANERWKLAKRIGRCC